jgi:acyl dehydratase
MARFFKPVKLPEDVRFISTLEGKFQVTYL